MGLVSDVQTLGTIAGANGKTFQGYSLCGQTECTKQWQYLTIGICK